MVSTATDNAPGQTVQEAATPASLAGVAGVFKAFGGIVAVGTLMMWLVGETYSADILAHYGISPNLIDKPFQMIALLGVQVLLQWVSDQANGGGVVLVITLVGGLVLLPLLLTRASVLMAGLVTVAACGAAILISPSIGHREAGGYLAELTPLIAACLADRRACTDYNTTQGSTVGGVLITADSSKLFVATPTGVTEIALASLASVALPQIFGAQQPVRTGAIPSPGVPSPTVNHNTNVGPATAGKSSNNQIAPTPSLPPIPGDPMPEMLPHTVPGLAGGTIMPNHVMPERRPPPFLHPTPTFMPDDKFKRRTNVVNTDEDGSINRAH